ncbi:hypothetical protein ABZZ74_52940 [Streptomyces sp. NPDC006476]|uniref:hypothetical protein n=1 Tax=Streptomyces sp. NPDC006476 TaxID=3157175 RepID=UPI0033B6A05C
MADEKDSANSSIRRQPWELVVSTIVSELFGLAFCGVAALVFWPFGWLPDPVFYLGMPAMFAAGPVGDMYRTGPPRRLAAVAVFLMTMTVALLFGATADWAFPPLADHDVGLFAGFLVSAPVGAGVFAWFSNRANVA